MDKKNLFIGWHDECKKYTYINPAWRVQIMEWIWVAKLRNVKLMSVTYVYVNKEMMHKLSFLLSNYNWFWILYILTP